MLFYLTIPSYSFSQITLFAQVQREDPNVAHQIFMILRSHISPEAFFVMFREDENSQTPIFFCCNHRDRPNLLRLILDIMDDMQFYFENHIHYSNINHQDINGQTCLFYAAKNNNTSSIKLILNKGGDPNIRDFKNRLAKDYCTRHRNESYKLLDLSSDTDHPKRRKIY